MFSATNVNKQGCYSFTIQVQLKDSLFVKEKYKP